MGEGVGGVDKSSVTSLDHAGLVLCETQTDELFYADESCVLVRMICTCFPLLVGAVMFSSAILPSVCIIRKVIL